MRGKGAFRWSLLGYDILTIWIIIIWFHRLWVFINGEMRHSWFLALVSQAVFSVCRLVRAMLRRFRCWEEELEFYGLDMKLYAI